MFQIKSRFGAAVVLFQFKTRVLKVALEAAVVARADLGGADLRSANLSGANLGCADLRSADLRGADLRSADLRFADLGGANLGGADLRSADLRNADLGGGHRVEGSFGIIFTWAAFGFVSEKGALRVCVGCRNFGIAEGRVYGGSTHCSPDARREVLAALDYIEAVARLRGYTGEPT